MALGNRSYANALFLENIFNVTPKRDMDLYRFARRVILPTVKVVIEDCKTLVGLKLQAETDTIGMINLANGQPITQAYLENLWRQGVYELRVRDTSTCTAPGGVCKACLAGAMARKKSTLTVPPVGSVVTLKGDSGAFLEYLGNTYSGALMGIESVPSTPLPIRSALYSTIVDHQTMDKLAGNLRALKMNSDEVDYTMTVKDELERALIMTAYYGVYGSAIN